MYLPTLLSLICTHAQFLATHQCVASHDLDEAMWIFVDVKLSRSCRVRIDRIPTVQLWIRELKSHGGIGA
jgi:hypothetical protein